MKSNPVLELGKLLEEVFAGAGALKKSNSAGLEGGGALTKSKSMILGGGWVLLVGLVVSLLGALGREEEAEEEAEEEDEDEEVGRLLLDPLSKEGFLGRVEVVEEEEEVEEVDLAGGRSSSSSSSYL